MVVKDFFKKITFNGVKFLGFFLLIFSILGLIQSLYSLKTYINRGSSGLDSDWKKNNRERIITKIEDGSPASEAGLKVGDIITKINGHKLDKENSDMLKIRGNPIAGSKLFLTVKRDNKIKNIEIVRKLDPLFDRLITILFSLIMPFLMMAYIFVGLWGILKSSYSFEIILITMVCFTFGCIMYVPYSVTKVFTFISEYLYFFEIKNYLGFLALFAPSFWLYLFMNFPKKNKFCKEHKILTLVLIFSWPIATMILGLLFRLSNISGFIFFSSSLILVFLGIKILARALKQAKNILQKRQLRLILFGIKVGGLSIISGWSFVLIFILLMKWFSFLQWIILPCFLITHIIGLIIPFTFLNSFFHRQLLETESALKRRMRYWVATLFLFFSYLIVIFVIVKLIIENFHLKDPSLIILFVLLTAITFYPLNTKLHTWLERKFYPEKTKYRENLKGYIKKLPGFIDATNLLKNFSDWIEETMGIKPAFAFAIGKNNLEGVPFRVEQKNSIVKRIKHGSNFFWDEITDEYKKEINTQERNWAMSNGISITLPMISYGELVGTLNIGKKSNKEDFSGGDLEIFKEASDQTAQALQNIRLLADSLEKKRLDKELELAREIQSQLLPQEIPYVKGLNLYGKMKPCFEVGGDYFDIISIDENKAVLALGDVSGKGAGAALLMANLQAGIRSVLRFSCSLPDILFEINNIICENTSPAQFITFFIGIWDYKTRTFQYVNAGHNPPILIKADKSLTKLSSTGLILGVLPDSKFTSEKITLSYNDVLTIFTDGIEETFNSKQEEFGTDRIIQILEENIQKSPEHIANAIFLKLEEFSKGTPTHDDSTLIIAKVIKK